MEEVSNYSKINIQVHLPSRLVKVLIRKRVVGDVLRGLIAWGIAGDINIIGVLINPDVIEAHVARHKLFYPVIYRSETVCHSQVHDYGQWLHWNRSLADVCIRAYCSSVKRPCFVLADEPSDISSRTRCVLERIGLVFFPIIPFVIESRLSGHGLLVCSSSVIVDVRDMLIVYSGVVCQNQ